VQRPCQMMVIDDVMVLVGAEHHRCGGERSFSLPSL
jgi:hypothetical protein